QRLVEVALEHGDPQGQGEKRMSPQVEQGDLVVRTQGRALLVSEGEPGRRLTAVAVEDPVGLVGLPPGDRPFWIVTVPLDQLGVTVDRKEELVQQVLTHESPPRHSGTT